MNKKIYNIAISAISAILGLTLLTGCGSTTTTSSKNLEEIKLTDSVLGIETTIKYPKDSEIVAEQGDEENVIIKKESANYMMNFYYVETDKDTFERDKENLQEDEECKFSETNYSGYSGYKYFDEYEDGYIVVLTTGNFDENDETVELDVEVKPIDEYDDNGDDIDFDPIFNSEEIQTILENISINENAEKAEIDGTISGDKDLVVKKFDAPEGYTLQQFGDTNGVTSVYFLNDEEAKYNNSSASVSVDLRDYFDYYKDAEAAAEYYSSDTRKYEKTDHNGITFYVYESEADIDKYSLIQDIFFDLDGHIYNMSYSLYEDVPEEIGNLLIDNVIENMYVYNK